VGFVVLYPAFSLDLSRFVHGPSLKNHGLSLVDVTPSSVVIVIASGFGLEVCAIVVLVVVGGVVIVLCIVVLVTSMCLFPAAANAGVCCILLRFGRLVGNQLGSSILCFFLVDVSFFLSFLLGLCYERGRLRKLIIIVRSNLATEPTMEARKNAPATPAKTQGTPATLQFSNAPKKQLNPYAKAPMPEKSIERYDIERNRIFTLVMDDNGRYVENGTSRTINKETEKKNDPLENVNMEDLDGISQPGYCYELNKQKRESEEGENNSNNKKMDGKPLAKPSEAITTTEIPNLFINMDNTQEFTPPTQHTDNTKVDTETHTLADDDERSDDRYTLFLTELNKVIETRVDNNVKPQMDKCLATITKLIEDKIGAATATNTVDRVFANPITP
jgi:hypothetical protein